MHGCLSGSGSHACLMQSKRLIPRGSAVFDLLSVPVSKQSERFVSGRHITLLLLLEI